MAKPQAQSEPQKAPYETPKILTLKVDLSFASSATDVEDLIQMPPKPAKAETPSRTKAAVAGGKPHSPHP
jgi:hypothetical protein